MQVGEKVFEDCLNKILTFDEKMVDFDKALIHTIKMPVICIKAKRTAIKACGDVIKADPPAIKACGDAIKADKDTIKLILIPKKLFRDASKKI